MTDVCTATRKLQLVTRDRSVLVFETGQEADIVAFRIQQPSTAMSTGRRGLLHSISQVPESAACARWGLPCATVLGEIDHAIAKGDRDKGSFWLALGAVGSGIAPVVAIAI